MIRFGPSGIPLSCKGRTLRDGIEDVHTLGLTALEVQLVRVNITERYALDEDVGIALKQLPGELVVELVRKERKKEPVILSDLNTKIKKGDILRILACGIAKDYQELKELGELAKELDVQLSLHTPYYMDLTGENEVAKRSLDSIKWGGLIANQMSANVVVTHLGLYGTLSKAKTMERVCKNLKYLRNWYRKHNIKSKLGLETSGRQEVFGSLDEIITICKKLPGLYPVLNFAHIHAREYGALKRKEDFQKAFNKVKKFTKGYYYIHFSGVEHEGGNEVRYTPIKKGDLKFEPLAECILDNKFDVTVISGSPLLEHDAMYMKVILERVLTKREAKSIKSTKRG